MFTWTSFENHWDMLLRESVRKQKETDIDRAQKILRILCTNKKKQLWNNINKHVKGRIYKKWVGSLNDENRLQNDKKEEQKEKFFLKENK